MHEHYISIDIETSGPIPGDYSMLTLGACAAGDDTKTLYLEFKPLNENAVPEAIQVSGLSQKKLARDGLEPADAMRSLNEWIQTTTPSDCTPVFVGLNAPFDWSFVNYYFIHFLGSNPFGFSAIDIKALYMGATGCTWKQTASSQIVKRLHPKRKGNHNALDDALYQAELFQLALGLTRESDRSRGDGSTTD